VGKSQAYADYLAANNLTDSTTAKKDFVNQNVDQYMKCEGDGSLCDNYGIGQAHGAYTIADAVTGAVDFASVNQGKDALSGYDKAMIFVSGAIIYSRGNRQIRQ